MAQNQNLIRDSVELINRNTVYKGRFEVARYRLRHRRHDGGWSDVIEREVFERGRAAAVLPYDPLRDEIVLIEQFRPGAYAAGLEPWLLEIVAGIVDEGETAQDVVRREAQEEAGLELGELVPIASCILSPGACSETLDIFVGRTDAGNAGGVFGLAHEHEDIRAAAFSVAQAEAMLAAGSVRNAVTVIALQWLLLNRTRLRDRWGAFER